MNIRFDQPEWLLLALLAAPLILLGWQTFRSMDRLRRTTALGLRSLLLLAIAIILAGPRMIDEHDRITVIGLLDISDSVQRFGQLPRPPDADHAANIQYLRDWFRKATKTKATDDRFGLIVFDGQATAISTPVRGRHVDDNLDVTMIDGTNIADAIRLGLAMFPADTIKRLVLLSDGNETIGDALEAAAQAAGLSSADIEIHQPRDSRLDANHTSRATPPGVPIDVAPIAYNVTRDAQIVRIEAPSTARPGQTVNLRIVMEATAPMAADLTLLREGARVDLNGAPGGGTSRRIELPAGQSVQTAQVVLAETPVNRFEAILEPVDPDDDALPDNNRAEAFTATPTKGKTLVLDTRGVDNPIADALRNAGLPVESGPPSLLPTDPLGLQAYDLIVLDNLAAYDLDREQHELLARYVNDAGGGLVMIGGDRSFGAGGWNGTALEEILPVELDPPKELRTPTAALVLVLDKSGSMGYDVAGARATQQQIANNGAAMAVESLHAGSLVGVVTFDFVAHEHVPLQPNDDPKAIADRIRAITPEGGTNIEPALRMADRMLRGVKVQKKHVVLLTDGRSYSRDMDALVDAMAADGIRITTIAVGDDPDEELLARMAQRSGGEYFAVRNPAMLPRVLVDSVQVINKPLIKEGEFRPIVRPTGSTLTAGMDSAPPLYGLVITAPRPDSHAAAGLQRIDREDNSSSASSTRRAYIGGPVTIEMSHPDGEPLLARCQAGLGRVAAFTSDADGSWSRAWLNWPGYAPFWTQLARTIARPTMSHDAELTTSISDGRLLMTLEVTRGEEGFLDYLQVDGTAYTPDRRSVPVRLAQVAPGRYEGSIPAPSAGNYIVALNPRSGNRHLAPVIGGTSQSTGRELARYQSNLALLEQIVQRTGGRRLDIDDPLEANLFDRTGLTPVISSLPAWRPFAWLALALFLLDVACRRIAWSWTAIRNRIVETSAMARLRHARGAEVATVLASLRTVATQVDQRLDAQSSGVDKAHPESPLKPPPEHTYEPPAPSGAPDAPAVARAIDTLLGRRSSDSKPPTESSQPSAQRDADAAPDADSPISKLAAKRRAKKRLDDPET